ncbi:MAG: DUF4445 domain-containing protein [Firmicutes bacterium]|nr:DUF4445 domain-containing protein [Bacillota bacterium]
MAKVTFYPDQKSIEVAAGITIHDAARLAGVLIESPCSCIGICGKCMVELAPESLANVYFEPEYRLPAEAADRGRVLSCQTRIIGDITVELVDSQPDKGLRVLSHGIELKPSPGGFIKKVFIERSRLTEVYAGRKLLGIEKGNTAGKSFGIVVDIGTTTLVASLVDLNSGREAGNVSALNPQAVHAQDVLSRIKFASVDEGLDTLYSGLVRELNRMIAQLAADSGVSTDNIYEVVYSGNTCMLHLAARVNPFTLGKYPYTPQIFGGTYLRAVEHGLKVSEMAMIYLPPIISSFVGADITSGILASGLYELNGVTLLVDIGTNGEMVLAVDGRLAATSTAAGPAFEGMNISCGMRASRGAIEQFKLEKDGVLKLKTIGETAPVGICGSGLIDVVGELVKHGLINKNGKLVEPDAKLIPAGLKGRLVESDGRLRFKLAENVYLTQKDIRQVQLAKGAIRVGIEFLLGSSGLKADDVDRVLIAGAFGYHLRPASLINIGLLPKEFKGRIEFIGNTSLTGGKGFLLDRGAREQIQGEIENVSVLDLASHPRFDRLFVNCLGF